MLTGGESGNRITGGGMLTATGVAVLMSMTGAAVMIVTGTTGETAIGHGRQSGAAGMTGIGETGTGAS